MIETNSVDLESLGNLVLAYVRPSSAGEGFDRWSIHAADGSVIGFAPDRVLALGSILHRGLVPVSLH